MIRIPRPVGTFVFLMAWLMPWRPAFRIRARQSKLCFYVHWRDLIGRHIAKYGTHEPLLTRWMSDYLAGSERGLFVDVGANLGWHAVHAAVHPTVETVVAFEPDPFKAWLLDRNLSLNQIDNVVVSNSAVGAQPGMIRLYRYKSSNCGRHSTLVDYGYGSRSVPITELDAALAALGLSDHRVLILKIDVEGGEPAVIAGALRTLAHTDVVVMEYSPGLSRSGGQSTGDMLATLHGQGFVPHRIAPDQGLSEITLDELRGADGQLDVIWLAPSRMRALHGAGLGFDPG
jgi:FkbM family methyltransferase